MSDPPQPPPPGLELFAQLNEEFRERPLVPSPPEQTSKGFEAVALGRIKTISRYLPDLAGCDVLEVGTGRGFTAALLPRQAGARHVTGIDVRAYPEWRAHDSATTTFIEGISQAGS